MLLAAGVLMSGCIIHQTVQPQTGEEEIGRYSRISQETAREMMSLDDGHIVVDVRRQDEYEAGHIPGAVCIPNETIGTEQPEELPDLDQIILVYCRSGCRSREAAQKLSEIGYQRIYEFGGILDWTGEIVREEPEADWEPEDSAEKTPVLVIEAGGSIFYADLERNPSAEELSERLSEGALELEMRDYGGFEKVGRLPWNIRTGDERITTQAGDVILYQGNQITIYYDRNTWEFTRIARIRDATRENLLEALGEGNVTVLFRIGHEEGIPEAD